MKTFPEEILAHKKEYAQLKNISIQEIEAEAKKIEEQINKSMNFFKEKEKLYLEKEKNKEKELVESIKKEIKENPLTTKEELSKKINIPEEKVKEDRDSITTKRRFLENNEIIVTSSLKKLAKTKEEQDLISPDSYKTTVKVNRKEDIMQF